jgi:hypothetical protein
LGGIFAQNSNLDVARDPTVVGRGARQTELVNTGLYGIRVEASRLPLVGVPPIPGVVANPPVELYALVQDARISGVTNGIEVFASGDDPLGPDNFNIVNFTALRNEVGRDGGGRSFYLSTVPTPLPLADGLIRANIFRNRPFGPAPALNIEFETGSFIQVRANDQANLSAINSSAAIIPAAPVVPTYLSTLVVPLPPYRDELGVVEPPFVPLPAPPPPPPLPVRPIICD